MVTSTSHLTHREFLRFLGLIRRPRYREPLAEMTVEGYLSTVAIAYQAVFVQPDWLQSVSRHTLFRIRSMAIDGILAGNLPTCSPRVQYQALADGRDGGMLELPPHDPRAFAKWYWGDDRSGAHPYEILAGDHEHGVMFRVDPMPEDPNAWDYELSVNTPEFGEIAVRMALVLDRARVPFEFRDHERTIGNLVLHRRRTSRPGSGKRSSRE